MALEQNLNLTCRIRSNSNSNFKRPYLGNETRFFRSAGAKILLSSRAFTYSFVKVASRHSFTLFRPLSVRKGTFSGCSRWVSLSVSCQYMPPGPLEMFEKTNLLGAPYFYMACQICDLFRLASFSHFHSDLLKTHLSQLCKVLETM